MVFIRFIGDFTDAERDHVRQQIESRWGQARCDVHGESLRFAVWKIGAKLQDYTGNFVRVWPACGIYFAWQTCCDDFDYTLSVELDREYELAVYEDLISDRNDSGRSNL